jgi:hypothetical protein
MPAKGSSKRSRRLCLRRQVAFSDDELQRLHAASKAAGKVAAKFMREAVLAAMGEAPMPKAKRHHASDVSIAELQRANWLLANLSKNVNQLARQANQGLVQVRRAEVEYLLNQHQLVLSKMAAVMERLVA